MTRGIAVAWEINTACILLHGSLPVIASGDLSDGFTLKLLSQNGGPPAWWFPVASL